MAADRGQGDGDALEKYYVPCDGEGDHIGTEKVPIFMEGREILPVMESG